MRKWLRTLYEVTLLDLRVLWLSLLVPILVLQGTAILQPNSAASERVVVAASLLQLLGVLQVAWGLHDVRVELGQPTIRSLFRAWLLKLRSLAWRTKPRVVELKGVGIAAGAGSVSGRGVVVNPSSIESRVAALESQVRWLQQDLQSEAAAAQRRVDTISTELRDENAKRRSETTQLRGLLDRLFVGGLDLEVAGLAWIVIGQLLTTWPLTFAPLAERLTL